MGLTYYEQVKKQNYKIGAIKRKTKAVAKKLVTEYLSEGIKENYGRKEIRELTDKAKKLNLHYMDEYPLLQDIEILIRLVTDNLFSHGAGNTKDPEIRQHYSDIALDIIDSYIFSKPKRY